MTKAAAAVITHEVYRRTSQLFWRHTTSTLAEFDLTILREESHRRGVVPIDDVHYLRVAMLPPHAQTVDLILVLVIDPERRITFGAFCG
jgi:hypothetical protein